MANILDDLSERWNKIGSQLGALRYTGPTAVNTEENYVNPEATKIAAPSLRELRQSLQTSTRGSSYNPNVRRMNLREALAGYGKGLGSIMSSAQSAATSSLLSQGKPLSRTVTTNAPEYDEYLTQQRGLQSQQFDIDQEYRKMSGAQQNTGKGTLYTYGNESMYGNEPGYEEWARAKSIEQENYKNAEAKKYQAALEEWDKTNSGRAFTDVSELNLGG